MGNNSIWRNIILVLLVGVASWQIYDLVQQASSDLLAHWGIVNIYYQGLIVLGVIVALLVVFGWSAKRIAQKIVNGG